MFAMATIKKTLSGSFYLSQKKKISNPKYTAPNKRATILSMGETLKKQASDRIPTNPISARIKIMML